MRQIVIFGIFIFCLVPLWCNNASADRITHFEYTACYTDVPVRDSPDPNAKILFMLPKGATVRVSDQKRHWVKIICREPSCEWQVGWVASTAMCPADK